MLSRLTEAERQYAMRYVNSADAAAKRPVWQVWVASLVLMVGGLVLAGYAIDLFLNSPSDSNVTYILLPGGVGGLLLVLVGAGVGRSACRSSARRRLATILRKLLADEPESPGSTS
jgi:hypothetical protein